MVVALRRAALAIAAAVFTATSASAAPALAWVALAELPREVGVVLDQVRRGGPFRYDRDGVVFGNREQRLPANARGYYREYTVPTPGARDRGARRLVCGGFTPTAPEACYYSDDHYQSFRSVRE